MTIDLIHTRENLFQRSDELDVSPNNLNNASITTDATVSPDGTSSAEKLIEDSSTAIHHRVYQTAVGEDSTTYTASIYLKADTRDEMFFLLWDLANSAVIMSVAFDLIAGTRISGGTNYTISNEGAGWFRVSVTGTTTTGITNLGVYGQLRDGASHVYDGDGSSGLYVWGISLTKTAGLIPYSKTEGSELVGPYGGVEIQPEYGYKDSGRKVETRSRVRSGAEYTYKWGDWDEIKIPVSKVTREVRNIVNSYWSSNADLEYQFDFDTTSVHLINKATPINALSKPYTNLYKGSIDLGTY